MTVTIPTTTPSTVNHLSSGKEGLTGVVLRGSDPEWTLSTKFLDTINRNYH